MVKNIVKLSAIVLLSVSACSSSNSKPLLIEFSADSSNIEFNNVDPAGLLQLKNLSASDPTLHELISVLQTPSEKDTVVKEIPVEGMVVVTDSNIVFKPQQPFVKNRNYLVITHLNARFGNLQKVMKSEMARSVQPLQKLLIR